MASEFQERLHPRDRKGKFAEGAHAVKGTHGVSLSELSKQSRAKQSFAKGSRMSQATKEKAELNAQKKRAKAAVEARAKSKTQTNGSLLLKQQQEKARASGALTGNPVKKKKPRSGSAALRRAYGVKVTIVK